MARREIVCMWIMCMLSEQSTSIRGRNISVVTVHNTRTSSTRHTMPTEANTLFNFIGRISLNGILNICPLMYAD